MTDTLSSYGAGLARTGIPSGYTLTIYPYGCAQFCLLSYTSQLVIMCSTSVTSCATCHLATRPKMTRMSSVTHLTFEIRQKRCVTYTLLRIVTPGGCSLLCESMFSPKSTWDGTKFCFIWSASRANSSWGAFEAREEFREGGGATRNALNGCPVVAVDPTSSCSESSVLDWLRDISGP
jgi:hypothetical protein